MTHLSGNNTTEDPLRARGFAQAFYIAKCLESGLRRQDIIEKFRGDGQLVDMWISFLIHNSFIQRHGGRWTMTDKPGRFFIE